MAGFVVTRDSWAEVYQNDYVKGKFWSAVDTSTPFYDELEKKETTHGTQRVALLQVGVAQGSGARAELQNLPAPGAKRWKNPITTCKYNYATVRSSGPSRVFADENAFVDYATELLGGAIEGFKLNIGRQTWGDGQGILALANGALAPGALTAPVDSPYGVGWGALASNTTYLVKQDMVVQFGTENNGGAGYTVGTVSGTGFNFTPPLLNAVADNATVSLLASANQEIEGWLKMVGTAAFMTTLGLSTTYHAIDRTLAPMWEGNVLNGNAQLSLAMIRALRDLIWKRTNDEKSNLFMTSSEIARDYEALLQPGVRFQPLRMEGGRTLLSHDGLKISKDASAPVKAFNLADTDMINWVQSGEPAWMNDGSGIMRQVSGLDAQEAARYWYSNLEAREPRRLGICYNVTVN